MAYNIKSKIVVHYFSVLILLGKKFKSECYHLLDHFTPLVMNLTSVRKGFH